MGSIEQDEYFFEKCFMLRYTYTLTLENNDEMNTVLYNLKIYFGMKTCLVFSKDVNRTRDVIIFIVLSSHFAIRKQNLFGFKNGQADFYFCNWTEGSILTTQNILLFLGYELVQ